MTSNQRAVAFAAQVERYILSLPPAMSDDAAIPRAVILADARAVLQNETREIPRWQLCELEKRLKQEIVIRVSDADERDQMRLAVEAVFRILLEPDSRRNERMAHCEPKRE